MSTAGRDHVEGDATANVAIHHQDAFPAHGGQLPEGATNGGPQHRQNLMMTDQAEEVEGGLSRLQRNERSDFAANAGDLHLFVDEHTARSEMGGEERVLVPRGAGDARRHRRGRGCVRAPRP